MWRAPNMTMTDSTALSGARRAEFEAAALDILRLHGVEEPPIPIEEILRRPADHLWQPDLVDLSLHSFDTHERYAARPTIARTVARYVGASHWARRRGLVDEGGLTPDEVRYLGRALLMPGAWMSALQPSERTPATVRVRFHVPRPDAAERLAELELRPEANPAA